MKFRKILAVLLALALLPGLLPSASADHVHTWRLQAARREPTCTEPGTGVYVCDCGERKTDTIPAPGHSWGGWATTRAATCGKAGTQARTCSRCGKTETKDIPATGKHSFGSWKTIQQVDCLVPGSISRSCYTCGFTETQSIPAPGHNWGEGEITREATATEEGEITYTCLNNPAHIKKESIPPAGEVSPASGGPAPAAKGPDPAESQPEITLEVSPDYEFESYEIDNFGGADVDIGINVHIPETVACTGDTPLRLFRFVRYNDETDAAWGSPSYYLFPVEINPPEKRNVPDVIELQYRNVYYGFDIDHTVPVPDDPDCDWTATLTIWYEGYPAGSESIDLDTTEPLCESNKCVLTLRYPPKAADPEASPDPEPEPHTEPKPHTEPEPQPASPVRTFCSPELRCTADGAAEWILTRCPGHETIARKASRLLRDAEGAEKEDARQAVVRLWTDAVNAEYDEMLAGANASAREIILAEKAAFEAQLAAYSALSAPDDPYAEASEILMHKAAMLCYENHTAPEPRTDLRAAAAAPALRPENAGSGLRRIAEQGASVHVLEVLPPEYLSIEAAAADADGAGSWKQVRQSWFGALERIVSEQYPEESGFRPAAAEALSAFTAWLDAREALLNLLYPGQPEAVQEILAGAVRARVLAMYFAK